MHTIPLRPIMASVGVVYNAHSVTCPLLPPLPLRLRRRGDLLLRHDHTVHAKDGSTPLRSNNSRQKRIEKASSVTAPSELSVAMSAAMPEPAEARDDMTDPQDSSFFDCRLPRHMAVDLSRDSPRGERLCDLLPTRPYAASTLNHQCRG
jgi:hypothetical protein